MNQLMHFLPLIILPWLRWTGRTKQIIQLGFVFIKYFVAGWVQRAKPIPFLNSATFIILSRYQVYGMYTE